MCDLAIPGAISVEIDSETADGCTTGVLIQVRLLFSDCVMAE